jgi:chromosome segregation ATPase
MLQISQKQLAATTQNLTDKYNADIAQSKQLQTDKVNDQTKRIVSDNEKINSLQAQVDSITAELNTLLASVPMTPAIQTQIQAKTQTRESLIGQITGLRADIQQSQMSIESVNAYTSDYLSNRKAEYDADMQRMTTPTQSQIQTLQSQIQDVKSQLSQLKCTP